MQRQLAAARAAQARADKAAEATGLLRAIEAVESIHHAEFAPAQRPVAPPPPSPDHAGLLKYHRAQAKAQVSFFARAARKAALAEAARRADVDAAQQAADLKRQQDSWQRKLDADWAALNQNASDTVIARLIEAFEDNEAAAAPAGVDGSEVFVVVAVPPVSAVPDRKPALTQAGNLSLKKLTKTETMALYKSLVCGHVLVTVKEAFAVAPGITTVTAVALRPGSLDAYGKLTSEVIIAGRFERTQLHAVRWQQTAAVRIFNDVATNRLLIERGATKELRPIDLTSEPQLAALAASVDFEDLLGG